MERYKRKATGVWRFFFGIIDGLKERTKNEKVWRRYERKATGVWLKEQTRNSVYTQGEL